MSAPSTMVISNDITTEQVDVDDQVNATVVHINGGKARTRSSLVRIGLWHRTVTEAPNVAMMWLYRRRLKS